MRYELSILYPVPADIRALEILARRPVPDRAVTTVHVFTLEVDQGLEWVKKNADELAARLGFAGRYTGLYVRPV